MSLFRHAGHRAVRLGELLQAAAEGTSVRLTAEGGALNFSAVAPKILRIRSGRGGEFSEDRSFAVPADKRLGIAPADLRETAETVEIWLESFKVIVGRRPMSLNIYDDEGHLLFRDFSPSGLIWKGRGVQVIHLAEPGACYYGFGEKTGPLNKRGRTMTMWNSDMPYHTNYDPLYLSVPFVLVLWRGRAHGLFFDNPGRARFQVASAHRWIFRYEAQWGELDLYVIAGPDVPGVVERFTSLVGRMPLPPRWALGHHQSRWSYMNEEEVRRIARRFRELDIPTDAIFLDIHYMDRYRVFTVDRQRFPHLRQLASNLAAEGFRLVAAVDPGVAQAEDYPLYLEGRQKGYFCKDKEGREFNPHVWPGRVGVPDFTRPEVRWWWGEAHKALLDEGIEGIWNDMNEPSLWRGSLRVKDLVIPFPQIKNPPLVHDDEGRNTHHGALRNVYGLLENQAAYEGLLRLRPGRRPFILSRSGYAGVQKYAANWTGDNFSTFSHLALTLPMLLNLGLSGIACCGPDIGGFGLNATPELYARWIQLGAFYPYCRTHTAIRTRRQEPWSFGERVTTIAREYLKLRYRFHPTLYSLFRICHDTGAPILRPLFWEFPEDQAALEIEDECLFGPSLLLAPVLRKGQRRREVYLPSAWWTDFWTGERIEGPTFISRAAPLETLPLYVREGAVFFLWPALRWLDERPVDRLWVEIYPAEKGAAEAVLYEDDGISDEYLRGVFSQRRVKHEQTAKGLVVHISPKEGPHCPPPRQLILKVHLVSRPESVKLDGRRVEFAAGQPGAKFLAARNVFRLSFPDDGEGHEVVIS